IAFHVGDRSTQSATALWEKIPTIYQKQAMFFTDQYAVYTGVLPSARHRAISKLARKTNHVERFNCTLRQRVSRLARYVVLLEEPGQSHRSHQIFHLSLQPHQVCSITRIALPADVWACQLRSLESPRVTGRISSKTNSEKGERGIFASPSLRENPFFGRLALSCPNINPQKSLPARPRPSRNNGNARLRGRTEEGRRGKRDFPEYSHASQRRHFRSAPKNFANSGFEPPQDHFHHVRAPAGAVIGGDEVVADPQRVEDHAAGLDLILVAAEGPKQRAQVIHSSVVYASEALGDCLLAPGPVANCEVDPQRLIAGGGERRQPPQLGPGVPARVLDALDHLVDARPLPRVEHFLEQRAPVRQ